MADVTFDKPNALLKAQLENQDDMMGRLLACRLLGDRKTDESVAMLEKALNEDPFYGVRIAAAEALAQHASDAAFTSLENGWQKQDDARVRLAVVERLTARYAEKTPDLISRVLVAEQNPAIKAAAIKGLGRFHGEDSRKQIVKFLESTSFRNELAAAAIAAIRQQDDSYYQQPLMAVLKQHEGRFTSSGFGRGLETLAHVCRSQDQKDDVREFLLSYVNHPKTSVRTSAISSLGVLGDSKAIAVLESLSGSGDERVARAADQALGKLRESKPTVPSELIELRKELATIKKDSEKAALGNRRAARPIEGQRVNRLRPPNCLPRSRAGQSNLAEIPPTRPR